MPEPTTKLRTCRTCGGTFELRRMGRPRIHCPHCTPRSDEDKRAAAEHWARMHVERARERNAAAREQLQLLAVRRERLWAERTRFE